MDAKEAAARKAAALVQNGMVVGLGTGTTATFAIEALAEKVKAGLSISAVASSVASENKARQLGIPITSFSEISTIDITIDGADEVDEYFNLIKGGGGALMREKILAYNSKQFIVIVDKTKRVDKLGAFPLPVEIISFAVPFTIKALEALGCAARIRQKEGNEFITDNGNLIADCNLTSIQNPKTLSIALQQIPGVVEHGLFLSNMVNQVIVGLDDGSTEEFMVTNSR